jgi:Transposase IS4
MLSFAGQKGYPYSDYAPFTIDEIKKHLAIYIMNGLSPSPRVDMKFNTQSVDEINGKYLVFRYFGTNALRKHKHFKAFFSIQDPRIIAPDRSSKPNWKVEPLQKLMKLASQAVWAVGEVFSVDEQTIGFQGHHRDKLREKKRQKGMVSNVIHFVKVDTHILFMTIMSHPLWNMWTWDYLHYIQEYWRFLIVYNISFIVAALTTCTCLQNFQGMLTYMVSRF